MSRGADDPSDFNRTALASGLSAYLIWGFAPLYFQALDFASPAEIVMHRVLWAMPVLFLVLAFAGKLGEAVNALRDRRVVLTLILTSIVISINWWGFTFAVTHGQVLQASLGYYINPLMSVAVGVIVLREPLGRWRIAAIVLATLGVLNLIIAAGQVPWIALMLATSFTAYGYLRKTVAVDGRIGLFWEVVFIAPLMLVGLIWLNTQSALQFFSDPISALLLVSAGIVTSIPLLLYVIGARGLRLSTMGIMQFTAPSLQFCIGIWGGEPFTTAHMITFGLIWAGVATFTYSQVRHRQDD